MTIVIAAVLAGAFAALAGALLGFAKQTWPTADGALVAAIDALLPQIQCAQCGYPGCRPYAIAISQGAPINRCPPGGEALVRSLSTLLGRSEHTAIDSRLPPFQNLLAFIDESRCIGCALCLPACPVDAIIGAHQQVHTVIARECTGCELCLPACPVDCIRLVRAHP